MPYYDPARAWSPQRKAKTRNQRAAARNAKKAAQNPLFTQAGLLDQVVALEDEQRWSERTVLYEDLGRDIASYERRLRWRERHARQYYACWQMSAEAIGAENVEEVEADWLSRRWRGHGMEYAISYLLDYLAQYTGRDKHTLLVEVDARAPQVAITQQQIDEIHRLVAERHSYGE